MYSSAPLARVKAAGGEAMLAISILRQILLWKPWKLICLTISSLLGVLKPQSVHKQSNTSTWGHSSRRISSSWTCFDTGHWSWQHCQNNLRSQPSHCSLWRWSHLSINNSKIIFLSVSFYIYYFEVETVPLEHHPHPGLDCHEHEDMYILLLLYPDRSYINTMKATNKCLKMPIVSDRSLAETSTIS